MSPFDLSEPPAWPAGGSETADLIRHHDWLDTSLGRIEDWLQSLRTLVELCLAHSLACAVICGPDRVLIYNDLCARLLGDAHPNVLGKPVGAGFPEALSDTGPIHDRMLAGEALTFRKRPWVFRRQGVLTTEHYDAFFTPVRDEAGAFAYVLAMIVQSPAESVASTNPPTGTHALAPDALWVLDPERMRLEYASPALDRLLGENRAKVQADFHRWIDLVHPDDLAAAEGHLARAAAGETLVTQYRIIRGLDAVVTVRHTSFPMQGSAGTAARVAGLVQDVTVIEQATAALTEEKERYRTLAEGIPTLVWRSCDEGLWTWAGPQWLDYTGQTQEQAQGWGWLDVVHPDDRDPTMQAWHKARPHGWLDVSFRLRRASDQSWRWHQTRSLPRRADSATGEPEGQIIEWLGSSTDIDDLKSLQLRQAAMIAELEQRTASMKDVIQSLRTPIR